MCHIVNTIVVLDHVELEQELHKKFAQEKTPFGETINVLRLDKSTGVAERDKAWIKADAEAAIREYFFGDAKKTLSPVTLSVSYDELGVFRALDGKSSCWFYSGPGQNDSSTLACLSKFLLLICGGNVIRIRIIRRRGIITASTRAGRDLIRAVPLDTRAHGRVGE